MVIYCDLILGMFRTGETPVRKAETGVSPVLRGKQARRLFYGCYY
ncbi:MAG: hypothetical protein SXA11_12470 [Cyanobacteriota bacterium]|nr:hypothetical protein [Cyanobacteriota bacterium]